MLLILYQTPTKAFVMLTNNKMFSVTHSSYARIYDMWNRKVLSCVKQELQGETLVTYFKRSM